MEKQSGIYAIVNLVNGKRYIGQTARGFDNRFKAHRTALRRKKHPNIHLQRSWDKHGEDVFEFRPLFTCPEWQLDEQEEVLLKADFSKYNLSFKAKPHRPVGIPSSEETKRKQSAALRGQKRSPEARRRMSEIQKKRAEALTEEERRRKSAAVSGHRNGHFGKPAHNRGKSSSPEVLEKVSAGVARWWANNRERLDASMKKAGEKRRGRKVSQETRAKISRAHQGRKFSEETLRRMSEAAKKRARDRVRNNLGRWEG